MFFILEKRVRFPFDTAFTNLRNTGSRKGVDVDSREVLFAESNTIELKVCLKRIEFRSSPRTDCVLAVVFPHASSAMIVFGTICHGKPFHSSPSSRRPPDFGRGPPHCLKKKATA